jgi:signal transduction histidine kinase
MAQAAHSQRPTDTTPDPAERRAMTAARRDTALEESKRSFLRMVSHELRTPLNSILGFSEILSAELYGPLGAPQYKEYAGIIRSSGLRLLKLVNQILDIARLESGAMDLDLRPESLDHAIDDALDTLHDELATRRTRIVVEGQGSLPSVVADPRGLRNVLANLIQNAAVFSPEGAQVRIGVQAAEGGAIDISIADNGPGLDPADIPRLLKPFEQGENALTRRSEGAGLGLPTCSLLCQAMNGRLKIGSAPGEGVTAKVRLPAA